MSDTRVTSEGRQGPRGAVGPTGPAGPAGSTGATGPGNASAPVIAAASIAGGNPPSFFANTGLEASITRAGAGQYEFTLTNPPASQLNLIILVTPVGPIGDFHAEAFTSSPSQFTVTTIDSTGTNVDASYFLAVLTAPLA